MTPEDTALVAWLIDAADVIDNEDVPLDSAKIEEAAATIRALSGEVEELEGYRTADSVVTNRLRAEVAALKGDLQLMKLSRDAKLCSECPRIPEWEALRKDSERYVWMRDQEGSTDDQIDAEMAAAKGPIA